MKYVKILVSFAACMLAFAGPAHAQDDSHGLITVRTTKVKMGRGDEYRELLAKLAASRKAAGHSGVTGWQVIRGPASTYYTVSSAENYAAFDEPFDSGMSEADWERWLSRITDVIEHSTLAILQTHGELSIPADPDSAPNMVMLRFSVLRPGNNSEHHEWLEKTLVPAMQGGNRKGWNISRVMIGDDVNTWVSSLRVDSWEQLDGPGPFAHMSERQRENMLEDYSERLQSSRTEMIRFLPELSY
jgi:hypothetical protein